MHNIFVWSFTIGAFFHGTIPTPYILSGKSTQVQLYAYLQNNLSNACILSGSCLWSMRCTVPLKSRLTGPQKLILDPQFSILDSWKTVRMEAWVKFQDVQVEYQDPQNSVLFSVFLVFFLVVSKGIKSRLCFSGARSPQATNIWSRATEKEKRSPVWVHRFRLVWKPETKPANI